MEPTSSDFKLFLNKFGYSSFYKRIIKESGSDLKINTMLSDLLFCLTSFSFSLSDIYSKIFNLLCVISFTDDEIVSIQNIFNECFVENALILPSRDDLLNYEYNFDNQCSVDTSKKPFESWIWNGTEWEAPTPYPTTGYSYIWNESTKRWNKV